MRAILLGLAMTAAAAVLTRAEQPFQAMDALSRAAYSEAAVRSCESLEPPSAGRLATAQRIAHVTGVPLDAVLTEFHAIRQDATARIARDGCDSPDVTAMRQYYHAAEQHGSQACADPRATMPANRERTVPRS
jgi:hypothetical protein